MEEIFLGITLFFWPTKTNKDQFKMPLFEHVTKTIFYGALPPPPTVCSSDAINVYINPSINNAPLPENQISISGYW